MSRFETFIILMVLAACTQMKPNGSQPDVESRSTPTPNPTPSPMPNPNPSPTGTLAQQYPRDNGIAGDSSVIWAEHFTAGSVSAVLNRYDSYQNSAGMTLMQDAPANSFSQYSMRLTSSPSNTATDFYKNFGSNGQDEVYVRWYAKYQPGVTWHHSGVWFGGYNPSSNWPSPQAGVRPDGSDRIAISIEPVWGTAQGNPKFDFYNYWMQMHNCTGCGTSYWGNPLISDDSFTVDEGSWVCIEVHLKLNTDLGSASGGTLEVWKNDNLIQSFTPSGPAGKWVQDHYCPNGTNASQCNYSSFGAGPVDLQFRTTNNLKINYFWPQNYITSGSAGSLWFSNMVMATRRIGCLVP